MATPKTTTLKPFTRKEFFSDDKNRVKEFMNKPGVRDKIYQMSQKYGVSPNEIVYSIYKETGGSFSPQQKGSNSSAIGLFQIMPEKPGANYRDFISYEPWAEGLEGTEQWRMKDGDTWGKFPLIPGEQYSSESGKGYQKGKRRFYMDDIAKMNELQQLELLDLYLGDTFRGSDYREGNVSKGKPGDVYTAIAWPDAVGAPGDTPIIPKGSQAYKDNPKWRSKQGLFKRGEITPNSIKDFGGRQEDWDSMFSNEMLGYNETYTPVEDTNPYPQFKFDDKGRVTFEEPVSEPTPENNKTKSVIDYSQFDLPPSFESDKTRVAPFNPVPITGGVASFEEFMDSYEKSGLPAEGFARGGQVIKNNDMKYNNYKHGGMHYGMPKYFLGGAIEKLTGGKGLFESITGKKFKDTGFGKGLRDVGVATLNTAAAPLESLMGTDFGIDEKFGYKTKFGEVYGGVGETAGSILGQLAPTALNVVAPGTGTALSMVGQSFGSGLEGAGITQDISTDPQSAMGSQIGGMMNMMAMMNPQGGAGQFTNSMGQTGFMQQLAAMLSGGQPTAKYGIDYKKYEQGGIAGPDVEVESGEVINSRGAMKSFTPGAPLKPIGNNAVEVGGNMSHKKGGAKIGFQSDAEVFSAVEKPKGSKKTYAEQAKTLNQLIEQAEKESQSGDFITRETAQMNLTKYKKQLKQLFDEQQRQNKGNSNVMAKKGGLVKANTGLQNIMLNPNAGSGGFGGMYGLGSQSGGFGGLGLGNQSGGLNNPNMNNIFGTTGLQGMSPELQAQMNVFNDLYGSRTNTGRGLNRNNPSQYERIPFNSQYGGIQGILPYASSVANIGIGMKGLLGGTGSLDASDYMIKPRTRDVNINKDAMIAPDMNAYTTAINSARTPIEKSAIHANFMPRLAKRLEGIDFLQDKIERQNIDAQNRADMINARTRYGIDMRNMELAAAPYEFLNEGFSGLADTATQMGQNKQMERYLYEMFPQYRKIS